MGNDHRGGSFCDNICEYFSRVNMAFVYKTNGDNPSIYNFVSAVDRYA